MVLSAEELRASSSCGEHGILYPTLLPVELMAGFGCQQLDPRGRRLCLGTLCRRQNNSITSSSAGRSLGPNPEGTPAPKLRSINSGEKEANANKWAPSPLTPPSALTCKARRWWPRQLPCINDWSPAPPRSNPCPVSVCHPDTGAHGLLCGFHIISHRRAARAGERRH